MLTNAINKLNVNGYILQILGVVALILGATSASSNTVSHPVLIPLGMLIFYIGALKKSSSLTVFAAIVIAVVIGLGVALFSTLTTIAALSLGSDALNGVSDSLFTLKTITVIGPIFLASILVPVLTAWASVRVKNGKPVSELATGAVLITSILLTILFFQIPTFG